MSPLAAMTLAVINTAMKKNIGYSLAFFLLLLPVLAATAQHSLAEQNLFDSEPPSSSTTSAQEMIIPPDSDSNHSVEPAISATEAALRAQNHVDGKVMNVRQLQEENRTFYGVKLLQKNGRIRTINVDANDGSIVE